MKRLVALVVVLMLLRGSCMAEEILFRGIPWGMGITEVIEILRVEFQWDEVMYGEDTLHRIWDYHVPFSDSFLTNNLLGYNHIPENVCGYYYSLPHRIPVAGYDYVDATIYAHYDLQGSDIDTSVDSSKFYAAEYCFEAEELSATYKDLVDKLTYLYGDGEIVEDNEEITDGFPIIRWDGDNNTALSIRAKLGFDYKDRSGEVYLNYYKTDCDEIIAGIDRIEKNKAMESVDVSGL